MTGQTNQEINDVGNKSKINFKFPCMVCQEDHMIKDCPRLTDVCNYVKQQQPSSELVVLTNPFPAPQQMVSQVPTPPSGSASSSFATI